MSRLDVILPFILFHFVLFIFSVGSFTYAWILDKLMKERVLGHSINIHHMKFKTSEKREITAMDVPGHRDYLKNTLMGISQADAAILMVSAVEDEYESNIKEDGQTQEYALLAYTMGKHFFCIYS